MQRKADTDGLFARRGDEEGGRAQRLGCCAARNDGVDLPGEHLEPAGRDVVIGALNGPRRSAGRKLFLHCHSVQGPEERTEVDGNYLVRETLDEPYVAELWQAG